MKKIRIICGCLAAMLTLAVIISVCFQWYDQGCDWWSLFAAICFYSVCSYGLWYSIDQVLADIQRREEEDIYYGPQKD